MDTDSFDQLIKLADEAMDACKGLVKNNQVLTVETTLMNYNKSIEICMDIQRRLDEVKMKEDGFSFAYDRCVYYMAKTLLNSYKHSALLVFTSQLHKKLAESTEQKTEQKQRKTLKFLIKEAIKEAQKEEKNPRKSLKNRI